MAQKPAAFFVAMEDSKEDKEDKEFAAQLQTVMGDLDLKKQLLANPNIAAISTKKWKSQKTTVIIAHLDRKFYNDPEATEIWETRPECLKLLSVKHEMMQKKPDSMVSVYAVLDAKKEPMQIAGKDVIVCVSKGKAAGGKESSIDSLKTPTNIIQPTKSGTGSGYQHNAKTNQEAATTFDSIVRDLKNRQYSEAAVKDLQTRLSWTAGSLCSVFSRTKKQWVDGRVIEAYVDTESNVEWLTVKYGRKSKKKMQRFCRDVKAAQSDDSYQFDHELTQIITDAPRKRAINNEKQMSDENNPVNPSHSSIDLPVLGDSTSDCNANASSKQQTLSTLSSPTPTHSNANAPSMEANDGGSSAMEMEHTCSAHM